LQNYSNQKRCDPIFKTLRKFYHQDQKPIEKSTLENPL